MSDEHTSFIKTPKQLVIVVLLAFAIPVALFVMLSQLVTGMKPAGAGEAVKVFTVRISVLMGKVWMPI